MKKEKELLCKFEVTFIVRLTSLATDSKELVKFLKMKWPKCIKENLADESLKMLREYIFSEQSRYFLTGIVDIRLRKHFRGVSLNEPERISSIINALKASRANCVVDENLVERNMFEFFWTAAKLHSTKKMRWIVGMVSVDHNADIRFKETPISFKASDFWIGNQYSIGMGENALLVRV